MKLPGIQHRGVQSLGRESPAAPQRVAAAQYRAVRQGQSLLENIDRTVDRLYREDAQAEAEERLLDYEERVETTRRELTENPYMEDEEGNMVSRHDKVFEEFIDAEEAARNEVLENTNNELARQELETVLRERSMEYRGSVAQTAAQWTKNESNRRYVTSIERSLRKGDHDRAQDLYVEAATGGSLSQKQLIEIPELIQADEQYSVIMEQVDELQEPEDYQSLRADIHDLDKYPALSDTQRGELGKAIDQRLDDVLTRGLHTVIEAEGLSSGLEYVRRVNRVNPKALGLSGEDAHYSVVSRLQSVYNDYRFQANENRSQRQLEADAAFINRGGYADPKDDKAAMDLAFEIWMDRGGDPDIEAGTGENAAQPVQPFGPEWMSRVQWHARTQGWIPPMVMSDIRGMLHHGEGDTVIAAAQIVSMLEDDAETVRAVKDNMSEDEIRLATMIDDYADYGQDPSETIKNIREGLHQVPESHKAARRTEFNSEYSPDADELLEDKISDDPDGAAWFQFFQSNPEATIELQEEYRRLMRNEYVRTGDEEFSSKRAYRLLRKKYAIVDRGDGQLRMSPMAPEALLADGRPVDWITEEFESAAEELGQDPANLELMHFRHNGKDKWYFYDKENNDIVESPDNPGQWATIDFDYDTSKKAQRERESFEEEMEAARIQMDRERAEERAREEHLDNFGHLEPSAGPGPRAPDPEAGSGRATAGKVADMLDSAGQKFWELVLGDPFEEDKKGKKPNEPHKGTGPGNVVPFRGN